MSFSILLTVTLALPAAAQNTYKRPVVNLCSDGRHVRACVEDESHTQPVSLLALRFSPDRRSYLLDISDPDPSTAVLLSAPNGSQTESAVQISTAALAPSIPATDAVPGAAALAPSTPATSAAPDTATLAASIPATSATPDAAASAPATAAPTIAASGGIEVAPVTGSTGNITQSTDNITQIMPLASNITSNVANAIRLNASFDCTVSEWSEWAECVDRLEDGLHSKFMLRERFINQPQQEGGAVCPILEDMMQCANPTAEGMLDWMVSWR